MLSSLCDKTISLFPLPFAPSSTEKIDILLKGCYAKAQVKARCWEESSNSSPTKKTKPAGRQWLTPVILATQEAEMRRII
jgi:hypothetical protein